MSSLLPFIFIDLQPSRVYAGIKCSAERQTIGDRSGINMQLAIHRDSQNGQRPKATDLENAARATLSPANHRLTDAEWRHARSKLLEFTRILLAWDQQAKTSAPETGNVMVRPNETCTMKRVQE